MAEARQRRTWRDVSTRLGVRARGARREAARLLPGNDRTALDLAVAVRRQDQRAGVGTEWVRSGWREGARGAPTGARQEREASAERALEDRGARRGEKGDGSSRAAR